MMSIFKSTRIGTTITSTILLIFFAMLNGGCETEPVLTEPLLTEATLSPKAISTEAAVKTAPYIVEVEVAILLHFL